MSNEDLIKQIDVLKMKLQDAERVVSFYAISENVENNSDDLEWNGKGWDSGYIARQYFRKWPYNV
jgi:hypothetical protein